MGSPDTDTGTGTIPIGMIPYANTGPFRVLGPPAGCRFVSYTPRRSTRALAQGRVLAAPVPVGDLPWLAPQVDLLGRFGIAAGGPVQSVLLLSRRPLPELAWPARLRLTDQSSSSVRLLYLLLGRRVGFGRLPGAVGDGHEADGELLIGDDALLVFNGRRRGRIITDLAEAWRTATGEPFVFARWVVRRDAPNELKQRLLAWLDTFAEQEEELVRLAAGQEAARVGISEEAMLGYLRQMTRVLGDEELAGQERFLQELRHRAPHLLDATTPCFPPAVPAPATARRTA